jgi:dihydrofolate reductase
VSKVKVNASISLDGFAAGPDQSLQNPQGVGGLALAEWAFATPTFRRMQGKDWMVPGIDSARTETGAVDDEFFARSFRDVGAYIFGRNMFGPVRGPWRDNSWQGWWGDRPPFRAPVFVLTHFPRDSQPMQGGTTFHFVTEGINQALAAAKTAARGKDVRIGGISTVRQYLRAGLVDELQLAISPILLGAGEQLLAGLDLVSLGYTCTSCVAGECATHVIIERTVSQQPRA